MGVTQKHLVTADELVRMDGDARYELMEGELRETAPNWSEHTVMGAKLQRLIGNYVDRRRLGTTTDADGGYLIGRDPDTVLAPDVGFVCASRLPLPKRSFIPGAPDLAVEVVSATDRPSEVKAKAHRWLDAGCRLLWVVWLERREVEVYRPGAPVRVLREDDTFDGEDVLPGFTCPVAEVFRP